jgi:hypothetical protein
MENLYSTIQIIRQPHKSHQQIAKLYEKLGRVDFFRNYSNNDQKAVVYELLSRMKLESCNANSIVFMRGEIANKFYIVLEGEVAVFLDDDKGSPTGCPYPEFEKIHRENSIFFDQTYGKFLMNRVAILKEGQAFGELGVMHNKPRVATVVAVKRCTFGVLMADDFRSTLQPSILNEADKKVRYFKYLLDQSCHFDEIWRLSAFFYRVKFDKYQTLVIENEEFERLFIITEGLIQLEKDIILDEESPSEPEVSFPKTGTGFLSTRNMCSTSVNLKNFFRAEPRTSTNRSGNFKIKTQRDSPMNETNLFKRTHRKKIHSQPVIVYGQNQFFGFKEFLESRNTNFFTAKVIEPGYGYWIHVSNMRHCFEDFRGFEAFFMSRHRPLLKTLNVDL